VGGESFDLMKQPFLRIRRRTIWLGIGVMFKTLLSFLASDAIVVDPTGEVTTGQAELEKNMTIFLLTPLKGLLIRVKLSESISKK
jgi:hypothetical protein